MEGCVLQVNEANAAVEELSRNVKRLTAELLRRMELKVRTALSGPRRPWLGRLLSRAVVCRDCRNETPQRELHRSF